MTDSSKLTLDPQRAKEVELAHKQAVKYGQDMAEIYKQERAKRIALEMAYKKLEGALESMSDGFLVIDKDLMIVETNQTCAELFEMVVDEITGKPLSGLLIGDKVDEFNNLLLNPTRKKQICQLSILMPLARNLLVHAAPLPDEGWVLVLHDVTWEERINNMREEFLNLAAHELRTPLAGIIGFTSLLEQMAQKEDMPEETWAILGNILKSSERLRSTITDLLDFTASDTEEAEVSLVDLQELVEDTVTLLNKKASEHKVQIFIDFPDEAMRVFCDRQMISTAIGHIIENSIKYNKLDGTVTIEGRIKSDKHELIFTDTGVGIVRKDLDYIFQPFYQVEEHTTRKAVGMGLGLSIAQRIIALHRGTLAATSELNVGSTFIMSLPYLKADNMEIARSEWLKIQKNLRNRAKKPEVNEQAQNLISQLKEQLERTQSQNLAYASDLAKLYQLQRADAEEFEAKKATIGHTDRLALMGQLAAGVAHDLSNLIGPILGYSQIILRNRDSIDSNMADIIERILNTSRRANILLRQMVTLSGNQADEYESIDIANLVQEMLMMLEVKINQANIDVVKEIAEDTPLVIANQVQISQVILNCLVNAIDAMPTGGVLTIETSQKQVNGETCMQLQISDTGSGIAPEDLPHIFDAFFTTKKDDNQSGTGLGLSVSKEIIDNHNGQITVDSTPNKGATFTILLPANQRN